MDDWQAEDQAQMNKLVEKMQREYGDTLRVKSKLKIGFGPDVIRELVAKGRIGAVVFGIAHTEKFNEVVFGSTGTDVAGTVSCPVIIVPDKARYRPWKSLAFAFDQQQIPTSTGLKVLKEWVVAYQSEIHFLNVMDTPFIEGDDSSLKPLYRRFGGLEMKTHFLPYRPNLVEEALLDWVRRHKISALVLVARRHNFLWRMFHERTTKKLAFNSTKPVIILSDK